jgi:hypothetical protein
MPKKQKAKSVRRTQASSTPNLRRPQTQVWNQLSQRTPALSNVMNNDKRTYTFRQVYELGPWLTSSAGGGTSTGIALVLSQLPQYATWTAAFDQYKIDFIEAWIQPTQASTVASPDGWRWYNVVDYDDDGTSITETQIQQYQNVQDLARTEACYRKWRPHVAIGSNVGGSVVLSVNQPSEWINCAQVNVKHFGLKVYMQATAITVVLTMRLRYTVSFRQVF